MRLGTADLGRVRFVEELHPVGTAVLASQALASAGAATLMPDLAARSRAATGPLHHLLPGRGMLPDFVTPYQGLDSVAAGLEAIRATPKRRVRAELSRAYAHLPTSPWRRRLAAGDRDAVDLLTCAVAAYFYTVLRPQWSDLRLGHRRQVDRAARAYGTSGVDAVLGNLHPAIRWRPPVLEIESWWSGDVTATGAGLLLVPSPFAGPWPRVLLEPGRPTLLVFPAPAPLPPVATDGDPLARLLGRTRAAVLRRLAEPGNHTTTALGRGVGISVPSASQHTAALRAAGLVTSRRNGGSVLHTPTRLAIHLLTDSTNPDPGHG